MKNKAGNKKKLFESIVHGIFLILGLITVGCVLLITVYLIISGIPAIKKIGLIPFLFGKTWASTSSEPSFGILPFILTSVYGTAGAIVLGVPIGFLTAVYISKYAPKKKRRRHAIRRQSACGYSVRRLRSCGYARFSPRDTENILSAGRRESARRDNRACGNDSAVDNKGVRHRFAGGAQRV